MSRAMCTPVIRRLIIRDARQKLRGVQQPKLYNQRAGLASLLTLAASAIFFFGLFWAGPDAYRYSLNKFFSTSADDQPPLYSIGSRTGEYKGGAPRRCGDSGPTAGILDREGNLDGQVRRATRLGNIRHAAPIWRGMISFFSFSTPGNVSTITSKQMGFARRRSRSTSPMCRLSAKLEILLTFSPAYLDGAQETRR